MFERNHLLSAISEITSSFNVRQKQRAVIEFLVLEGESLINIFQRLEKVYGNAAIGYSAVKKWVARIKSKEEDPSLSDLRYKPRSGRPSSAVNPGNSGRAEELMRDAHKQARLEGCLELLECHADDETFFKLIVTGDETWVHHYKPGSKRASMEWRHPSSSKAKKFKESALIWKSYSICALGR